MRVRLGKSSVRQVGTSLVSYVRHQSTRVGHVAAVLHVVDIITVRKTRKVEEALDIFQRALSMQHQPYALDIVSRWHVENRGKCAVCLCLLCV